MNVWEKLENCTCPKWCNIYRISRTIIKEWISWNSFEKNLKVWVWFQKSWKECQESLKASFWANRVSDESIANGCPLSRQALQNTEKALLKRVSILAKRIWKSEENNSEEENNNERLKKLEECANVTPNDWCA